jgi:hypothetical protein
MFHPFHRVLHADLGLPLLLLLQELGAILIKRFRRRTLLQGRKLILETKF